MPHVEQPPFARRLLEARPLTLTLPPSAAA